MNLDINNLKNPKLYILAIAFVGLEKKLEYPNCEGADDRKRITEQFEREILDLGIL